MLEHLRMMFGSVNESIKKFQEQLKQGALARVYVQNEIKKKELELGTLEALLMGHEDRDAPAPPGSVYTED